MCFFEITNVKKCFASQQQTTFLFQADITASGNYILANINSKGVYRVWYDDEIFNQLVAKLNQPSFEVRHCVVCFLKRKDVKRIKI